VQYGDKDEKEDGIKGRNREKTKNIINKTVKNKSFRNENQ
jgi:hypothetical protein